MKFTDRAGAGRTLAGKLLHYAGRDDTVVLALPRGGVPVAFEIARQLEAPLEVFLVRKLGVPGQEEFARARHPAARGDRGDRARAAAARAAGAALPRATGGTPDARQVRHPGRRRPGDRVDGARRGRLAARARR